MLHWIKNHLPNLNDDNKLDDLALAAMLGVFAYTLYTILLR